MSIRAPQMSTFANLPRPNSQAARQQMQQAQERRSQQRGIHIGRSGYFQTGGPARSREYEPGGRDLAYKIVQTDSGAMLRWFNQNYGTLGPGLWTNAQLEAAIERYFAEKRPSTIYGGTASPFDEVSVSTSAMTHSKTPTKTAQTTKSQPKAPPIKPGVAYASKAKRLLSRRRRPGFRRVKYT